MISFVSFGTHLCDFRVGCVSISHMFGGNSFVCLDQWFSISGNFPYPHPSRHWIMSEDIFGCHSLVGGPSVGSRQDTVKHPTMCRAALIIENYVVPNIHSAEAEKPWAKTVKTITNWSKTCD